MNAYLLWSTEHQAWWRAGKRGYTVSIAHAGLYPRAEAIAVCFGNLYAKSTWTRPTPPDEILIAFDDLPSDIQLLIKETKND